MPGKNFFHSALLYSLIVLSGYLLMLGAMRDSLAIETLQLSLQHMVGEGVQLSGLQTQLGFSADNQLQLDVTIAAASIAGVGEAKDLSLHCATFQPSPVMRCRNGQLALTTPTKQRLSVPVAATYHTTTGRLELNLDKLDGYWQSLNLQWQPANHSQLTINGQGVALAVYSLAREYIELPELVVSTGQLDMQLQLELQQGELVHFELEGALSDAALSNQDTTQAMEAVSAMLAVNAHQTQGQWRGDIELDLKSGYVYSDPLGIDASAYPLRFTTQFAWQPAAAVSLNEMHWRQPGVADVTGDMRLGLQEGVQLQQLALDARSLAMDQVYASYIQPWLYQFDIPQLALAGDLSGELDWRGEALRLNLQLNDLAVQESAGQFGIQGVSGQLAWSNQQERYDSALQWQAAHFYNLPFGAARLAFSTNANELVLSEPLTVPLLDGSLQIDEGYLRNPVSEDMAWSMNAYLEPVSMQQLTEALGWQTFGGKLSGIIPELRYRNRRLELDGTLLVSAFDGDMTVNNLSIDQPFGLVPRMRADVAIDNLDLEAVTGTFSFGKIEGRLDGYIRELQMLAWQPVRFDALLITPENDDSRHRISQRAVDNLTRIGGGVGGALSRGFLSFFETFPYDRLGLGCRLQNGVCQMRGVEPAEQGYYIVKGRFLPPRIDIIGYADQVDWSQLVDQLVEVTRSGEVTVQ